MAVEGVPPVLFRVFGQLGEAESHAIQQWVSDRIEDQLRSRLTVAERVVTGLQDLDARKTEIINEMNVQEARVSDLVANSNALNVKLNTAFSEMQTEILKTQAATSATFEAARVALPMPNPLLQQVYHRILQFR